MENDVILLRAENEMKQIFVFGCGELFCKKQKSILKKYEIIGIYDNFKTGEYRLENGKTVPVILPDKKTINKYPVAIMKVDFFQIWNQLLELGMEPELVVFPYRIEPLYGIEKQLFSSGETLEAQGSVLIYHDKWGDTYTIDNITDFDNLIKIQERHLIDGMAILQACPMYPLNRVFGFSRGTPIDRYYIEKFLNEKRECIRGKVLEVAEDTYTRKYGTNVTEFFMLHVSSEAPGFIKGNFETGEGIEAETMDCIILTQVLPFIFYCSAAIFNIYRMLKPGGSCLITVNGISQISRYDMERWGHYWQFTDLSLRRLLEREVPKDKVQIKTYGNVKSATAMLYGMASEELSQKELDDVDDDYQVSICAVIWK